MKRTSKYLEAVVRELSRLPGIGAKTASRLAFHLLSSPESDVERLAESIITLKRNSRICSECGGISDDEVCGICSDPERDRALLCVVESARDILIIEGTGEFSGRYHVIGGLISPLDGVGAEDLRIESLAERTSKNSVREIILAINPTIEGEVTALYIANLFRGKDVSVSRIAHGLPVGADLEFADSATIIKSIEGRVKIL